MARRKNTGPVTVKVAKSFDGLVRGETFETDLTDRALALVSGGFLEVVSHGASEDRPGSDGPDHSGGEQASREAASPAGAEPSEDSRAG